MEEEAYYVNVREPVETRRRLLETSRQVVLSLQKYENYKLKREKKHEHVDRLRKNLREINELILRLKKELPQVKIKKKVSPEQEKPEAKITKKFSSSKNAITDLERELGNIEEKLKRLR